MWWLVKKEWLEVIRDKRALAAAFATGIFGPILLFVMFNSVIEKQTETVVTQVALTGVKEGSYFTDYLTHQGVEFQHIAWELQAFKEDKEFDAWIHAEDGKLTIYSKVDSEKSVKKKRQLEQVIGSFQRSVINQHLLVEGVNLSQSPFELHFFEIEDADPIGQRLLSSLLVFILISPFFSALSVANDATAGEREKGTLMALMTQPISPMQVAMAKWLVISAVGVIGLGITVVINSIVLQQLPLYELGIELDLSALNWLLIFIFMIPIALMGASIQMLVAIAAKSFKEGTSYLTMVSILPMLVAFIPAIIDDLGQLKLVPIIAQQQLFKDLLLATDPGFSTSLIASVFCLVVAFLALLGFRYKIVKPNIIQGY